MTRIQKETAYLESAIGRYWSRQFMTTTSLINSPWTLLTHRCKIFGQLIDALVLLFIYGH